MIVGGCDVVVCLVAGWYGTHELYVYSLTVVELQGAGGAYTRSLITLYIVELSRATLI